MVKGMVIEDESFGDPTTSTSSPPLVPLGHNDRPNTDIESCEITPIERSIACQTTTSTTTTNINTIVIY
jgi:hypothetical protein